MIDREEVRLLFYSPLRYPGGKGKLAPFMELLIEKTGHRGGTYIEPFAGGAGIALELLEKRVVSNIVINDFDKGVYSFWRAILEDTERFISEIIKVPISIEEWKKQKEICLGYNRKYSFELGFATFYLNRTNRSGIIKGGVIGGQNQSGDWKIDARFNKEELVERIEKIADMKRKIHLYNKDVESFIKIYAPKYSNNALMYLDPPYYNKGKQLYLNFFDDADHERIEQLVNNYVLCDWIITYDQAPKIVDIYEGYDMLQYDLNYSLSEKKKASELMIFKNVKMIPSEEEMKKCRIGLNLR